MFCKRKDLLFDGKTNPLNPPLVKGGLGGITGSHYFLYFSIIQGGILMGTMPLYVTSGASGVAFHL